MTDETNAIGGQLAFALFAAGNPHATLYYHVGNIVLMGSKKQMRRIHTRPHVATVQNTKRLATFVERDRPMM